MVIAQNFRDTSDRTASARESLMEYVKRCGGEAMWDFCFENWETFLGNGGNGSLVCKFHFPFGSCPRWPFLRAARQLEGEARRSQLVKFPL